MDYVGFLEAVKKLNKNSSFYGNAVLYKMAAPSEISKPEQLAGAMWLIGRSYAASPQRRSYGKENKWPVRPDNDGRDGFFKYIAKIIAKEMNQSCPKLEELPFSENVPEELAASIAAVLNFNLALSDAIKKFDKAPDKAICNNHISFCSKFLHFYYPQAVFIIDDYAETGAISLFNGDEDKHWRYICNPDDEDTYDPLKVQQNHTEYSFTGEVYKEFNKDTVNEYVKELNNRQVIKDIMEKYGERNPNAAQNYIAHCVRSYLLGCKLNGVVEPWVNLTEEKERILSMPRLTDTVFLNIKRSLTQSEWDKYRQLHQQYGLYQELPAEMPK